MLRSLFAATALLGLAFSTSATAQLKAPAAPRGATGPALTAPPAAAPSAPAPAPDAAQPSATGEKEAAGRNAAAGWLTLLDRRDWGTAWESTASMFRGSVPLANWMDGIPKVRGDLGPLVERKPSGSVYKDQLEGRPAGDYVSVLFASKFEKREVEELVTTVRDPDGRWRVTGYSVR